MSVELKIRPVENCLGAIFPKEILSRFNAGAGDTLYLTEAADGYRLTAADPDLGKLLGSAEKVMSRYPNTLRELAK